MSELQSDGQYLAHFDTYLLTEKRVAENTFLAYKRDIKQLIIFLAKNGLSLAKALKDDLRLWVKELNDAGISAKSVARKISAVKLLYNFLSDQFKLENQAQALVFPKVEKKLPVYLTDVEIKLLLEASSADESPKGLRNKVMIHMLYATGMRVSELTNLSVDQLQFDTGFVQLMGKGKKERMVPLPKATLELVRNYLDGGHRVQLSQVQNNEGNYLFATKIRGKLQPISRQSVWNILKSTIKAAGIAKNISPHSLRHSLATHLLRNGANIRSLQMLLGHEQLTTVQVYTHLEDTQLRKIYDKAHPRSQ